jgi:hypothetical protein
LRGNFVVANGGAEHIVLRDHGTNGHEDLNPAKRDEFPRRNTYVNLARSVPLLFSFLLFSCGPPKDQAVLGSVFQIEGTGTISGKAAPSKTRRLSRDEKFAPGEEIRLRGESVAVLCLTPGIYLRCFRETYLGIEALSVSKDGDETGNAMHMRRAAIRFEEGRVHVLLPAAGPSRADLRVHSRFGTLSAKVGSLFSITLKGDSMRVLCARGELTWSESPSGSTTLGAGYFSDRRSGEDSAVGPRLAADDPAAQGEIMALLDSAEAIANLETAARNAPAPWRR